MTDTPPRLLRLAPLLGPLLAVGFVFSDVLFGGRVFFDRDVQAYWLPHVATFVRVVGQGAWPLWNPYEGFGVPLLADPSLQLAYPPTWLNFVLLPANMYKLLVVGHALLAGAGAILLARRWGMSRLAAGLAGTAWAVSGPLLSAGSLFQHFCGAAWMAWVLLALEDALAAPGARSLGRLAAAAAAAALTGSADMCLLTSLAAGGRLAFWLAQPEARASRRAVGATVGAAVGLAFALAAVQWVPSAALLGSVVRGNLEAAHVLTWSVHPLSLVDLVVPRFYADLPLSPAMRELLFDGREPFLVSLYVGLSSLGLVALAGSSRWRTYASSMVVLFGLAALGRHVWLVPTLLTTPPFNLSRYPAKYALPCALFWALLAGLGLDAWRRPWGAAERRRATAVLVLMALVAVGAAAGALWVRRDVHPAMRLLRVPDAFPAEASFLLNAKLGRTAAIALATAALLAARRVRDAARGPLALGIALLAAADLASAGRGVNPAGPPELLEHRPRALDLVGTDGDDRRVLAVGGELAWLNAHFKAGVVGWDRRESWALGIQDALTPPIGTRWGLRGSYDSDVTGLATPAFHFLAGALLHNQAAPVALKLMRMGNVGHVVAVQPNAFRGLVEVGRVPSVFDEPVRVSTVTDPLPPAWVVGGSRPADSPTAALLAFAEADFDPGAEVVLGADAPRVPPPSGFRGRCDVAQRRADALILDVESTHPGHVVVAEAYQRGWSAAVDGAPAAVVPGNVLFRAVAVPAGRHRVELRYRPRSVAWGAGLTAAGLAVVAVLLRRGR